ncbi:MAG: hypothetical protein R6U78_02910 [Bacteroidales bacterium]
MKKLLLILVLPLILISCPKEETTPEDEDPGENPQTILAEADIGPSGATLEAEGISLTVPPGTFPGTFTVQISEETEHTEDFGENTASPSFRITGIPQDYSGSLVLRIQYEGTLKDEYYMALGEIDQIYESVDDPDEDHVEEPEDGKEVPVYALYDATDSSGYLVARIPSPGELPEQLSGQESGLKSTMSLGPFGVVVKAVYDCFTIEGTYFTVTCPFISERDKAISLARYMDEAMETYVGMKLADLGKIVTVIMYRKKKINVVVTGQDPDKGRPHVLKMPPLGHCTLDESGYVPVERYIWSAEMKLNISRAALGQYSDQEIKSWAYLWVYRMLYYTYFGDKMDWFAYASAYWMREKYGGTSGISEFVAAFGTTSPLWGMEAGKEWYKKPYQMTSLDIGGRIFRNEEWHAIGMYPFVKYLDQTYFAGDKEIYDRILKQILLGESGTPMEGIINALEAPEYTWWPGFFKEYLTLELTNLSASDFMQSLHMISQINFKNETDTTWLSDGDYPDLSANLYKVSFLFPEFKNEASLNLKVGPSSLNLDYVTAMAFGLKNNTLEYFDHAPDLTISNLKALKENGYSIMVAVINSASDPKKPLPDGSPTPEDPLHIELDTRLQTKPDFNYVAINGIIARADFIDADGTTTEQQFWVETEPRQGEMTGYTFTASWSEPWFEGSEQTCSGTIEIQFDPERFPDYITRYSFTETCEEDVAVHTRTIVGENLEFRGYPHPDLTVASRYFYVEGTGACSYITSMDETYTSYGGEVLSQSVDGTLRCDDYSLVDILVAYSPY